MAETAAEIEAKKKKDEEEMKKKKVGEELLDVALIIRALQRNYKIASEN